jgi:hypothetical protein
VLADAATAIKEGPENAATARRTKSRRPTSVPAALKAMAAGPTPETLGRAAIAFDDLKAASAGAADELKASCPAEMPQIPMDRLDAVEKRLLAMVQAVKTLRPALDKFYSALSDEQKARFNTMGWGTGSGRHPS